MKIYPCIFWGSEKSARIFLGSNFCQANRSYAIQAKVPARSERQKGSMYTYTVLKIAFLGIKVMYFLGSKISSLVFFWVHNIRSMYFFGCKILGSVRPPCHVYTRVPPLGRSGAPDKNIKMFKCCLLCSQYI